MVVGPGDGENEDGDIRWVAVISGGIEFARVRVDGGGGKQCSSRRLLEPLLAAVGEGVEVARVRWRWPMGANSLRGRGFLSV